MFWLSYKRWDFTDFGGFWYKSGGRTTGGRSGGKSVIGSWHVTSKIG